MEYKGDQQENLQIGECLLIIKKGKVFLQKKFYLVFLS